MLKDSSHVSKEFVFGEFSSLEADDFRSLVPGPVRRMSIGLLIIWAAVRVARVAGFSLPDFCSPRIRVLK